MAKTLPTGVQGTSGPFERHGLSDEQLRWLLRNMLLQRTLDNRGFQLNRQGKIPFAMGSEGHEALQAGAALAFERGKDVLVPYYRDIGLALGVGYTPYEALLAMFARGADRSGGRQFPNHPSGRDHGILSVSSIIAAHLPHAVGVAYAFKLRKERGRVVLATFGDGSTSEGEWHESLNFAAVHKLPVVFLCENNGIAISVPQTQQMAIADICKRAAGYGIPGVACNGLDPIATYSTVKEAFDRARSGGGPTLVEAKCYRYLAHSTDDDDRTYRSREEVQHHRKANDPVPHFEALLVEHGVIEAHAVATLKKAILHEINEATDRAEAQPLPAPSELYRNVYEGSHDAWR
jgi:2-oxoisovalerate dehydrogenase E1 component alpha subunit